MITVTAPWWGWLLFWFFLVPVTQLAHFLGDKTGRALGRWAEKRRLRREVTLVDWSRRG